MSEVFLTVYPNSLSRTEIRVTAPDFKKVLTKNSQLTAGPAQKPAGQPCVVTIGELMSIKNENWMTAKRKYRLTDVQIQMARELEMNPSKP